MIFFVQYIKNVFALQICGEEVMPGVTENLSAGCSTGKSMDMAALVGSYDTGVGTICPLTDSFLKG